MKIVVENKVAVLPQNFSFDYIAENRLFLGRDGYTLNIKFPMADCPQNVEIFGHINRKDFEKNNVSYECTLIDGSTAIYGALLVTRVSDTDIECQFAEGRCEQTVTDPFENVYITDLDLGEPPSTESFTPVQAWKGIDQGRDDVALPWINESYPEAFNNWVVFENDGYVWDKNVRVGRNPVSEHSPSLPGTSLSWQPYLITIAKRICQAVDYTFDFSEWESSDYKYLIICNTLPYTWDEGDLRKYKSAMPQWSVSEFFAKLELLLMCEFDIDHKAKHITFTFTKTVLESIPPVEISSVIDDYNVEISTDAQSCEYVGAKRLTYKECSHQMQPYYACDWFLENPTTVKSYPNVNDLIDANKRHVVVGLWGTEYLAYGDGAFVFEGRNDPSSAMVTNITSRVMFAEAENTYFVFRAIGLHKDFVGRPKDSQMFVLQPINVFGSGMPESDDVNSEEIDFVPVCVCDTHISDEDDKGYMMHLSFSSYDEDSPAEADSDGFRQPLPASTIVAGKKESKSGYYDVIYVAFWDGTIPEYGKSPYPLIDSVNITQDWTCFRTHLIGLRLTGQNRTACVAQINPKQKFKFSWLSTSIPNPRAIFYIKGRRYLCEKITATFTEDGMSQLLKGEFYPVID